MKKFQNSILQYIDRMQKLNAGLYIETGELKSRNKEELEWSNVIENKNKTMKSGLAWIRRVLYYILFRL